MNIPREAIEKATEGGWLFFSTPVDLPMVEKAKHEAVHVADIALDPTFWQALGKGVNVDKIWDIEVAGKKLWMFKAWQFYDLILQGKSTDEFWQELLK